VGVVVIVWKVGVVEPLFIRERRNLSHSYLDRWAFAFFHFDSKIEIEMEKENREYRRSRKCIF